MSRPVAADPATPQPRTTAAVEDYLERISELIKTKGYAKEQDSLAAAGMALVDLVKAGKAHLK